MTSQRTRDHRPDTPPAPPTAAAADPTTGPTPAVAQVHALRLADITDNPRAIKAFLRLKITTVGEFLTTPPATLLAAKGFGVRTHAAVRQRIDALLAGAESSPADLLPPALASFELEHLGLPSELVAAIDRLGAKDVGGVFALGPATLAADPAIGRTGVARFRDALDTVVEEGLEHIHRPGRLQTYGDLIATLESVLDQDQVELFEARVGLGRRPEQRLTVALRQRVPEPAIAQREGALIARLRARAPALLHRLRHEMLRELRAFEGMVTADRLAPGTLLFAVSRQSSDRELPLRMVAFCWPDEFHFAGAMLCNLSSRQLRALRQALRRLSTSGRLPLPLADVEAELRAIVDPVPREFVLTLLREQFHANVRIDPRHGEVIERQTVSVADRIHEVLDDCGEPLSIDDILFHYRDRHRRGKRAKLLDHLRDDSRFLEVEPEVWSLRVRHLDELEMARVEAERISARIQDLGSRHSVLDLASEDGLSPRTIHLLRDLLRRDRALRDLGRGHFCPRSERSSRLVETIVADLRRAAGELPFSRFLQNQPDHLRRLVSTLLRSNRAFVSPRPDRVDLLENYPFSQERLTRLLLTTDECIASNGGYQTLAAVRAAIDDMQLGGSWLTDHLLLDVLRRHGDYEILPGDLVAQSDLGLIGWIQQRAREAIRALGHPATPQQVIAEQPELARFHDSIAELLECDPMVQSVDGLSYQVI